MAKRRKPRAPASAPTTAASGQSNHLTEAIRRAGDDEARTQILEQTHPLHQERSEGWRILLDAFEGSGGFGNGEYLWQYANEKDDEFQNRQAMARYHNFAKSLVNIYVRHVFREGVKREVTGHDELTAWWNDVDGARTPIDDFMKRAARLALATGHTGCLVDKTPDLPSGPSLADDRGQIIASLFPAPSILDWRLKAGALVGVKLLEGASPSAITDEVLTGDAATQYLLWDREGWARFTHTGEVLAASVPGKGALGLVPLSILRPEPSAEHPFLGMSLLGDPNVYRALLNRCSEQDEVARDQAFSLLVVSVSPEGDVTKAKQQLGTDIGTTRAIVVQGAASYVTADMGVLEAIGKLIDFLIREIYRAAHVRWEMDSADAQSADAISLQHTELNEMLANLGAECQRVEMEMVRHWFRWKFPAATADDAFDKAKVTITYPREFFIADLLVELEKWANALKLDLGLTFEHYAKLRVVDQLAPDLPDETKKTIRDEIEAQQSTREQAMEDAKARLEGSVARLGGKKPGAPEPKPEPKAA